MPSNLLASALVTSLAVVVAGADANAQEERPAVGELYPDVRLPTIDGDRTVSLTSLRGRKVLLIEFASW